VTARTAGNLVGIKMVDDASEVGQGVQRPTGKDRVAPVVEHPQGVETPEDVATGLMDDRDNEGAAVGHLLEQVHQQL